MLIFTPMTTTGGNMGLFYYGARYYDPKVSVWLSVDPKASKYPSLSPYAFVANNPLNMIDPNGMEIEIVGADGSTTTYTPGMEYDGDDKYTSNVVAAYNEAYSASDEAKSHIDNTVNTDNVYSVVQGEENNFSPVQLVDANTGESSSGGGTITFNPNGQEVPVQRSEGSLTSKMEASPLMGLMHETVHASRHEDGLWNSVPEFQGVPVEELETSHIENIMRSQMGMPLRTHYQVGVTPNGSKKGTGFNLLKYSGGMISNYHWKTAKKRLSY
jgi:RHS repeat-associated protein